MVRPLVAFLHRSGIHKYLRDQWRADDASAKDSLQKYVSKLTEKSATRAELREHARAVEARLDELAFSVRHLSDVLAFNSEHRELRHASAFETERIRSHVAAAVDCARMDIDPAPHVIVDSILPADVYAAILDGIPPESCFSQRDLTKQNFKPADHDLVPDYSARTWRFFEQEIVAGALLPALVKKFQPHLGSVYRDKYARDADAIAALPLHATGSRLMLRRPGYHLDPHLDPRRVFVTCLVYLAHPGDNQEFGTQFFRINRQPQVDRSNTYFPEEHGYVCELVRTVPFTANTAVAFLNHDCAHGADIPSSAPKVTRRYAYQFYIAPDPTAAAAILGSAEDDD